MSILLLIIITKIYSMLFVDYFVTSQYGLWIALFP